MFSNLRSKPDHFGCQPAVDVFTGSIQYLGRFPTGDCWYWMFFTIHWSENSQTGRCSQNKSRHGVSATTLFGPAMQASLAFPARQVLSCNRDGMEALRKGQSKAVRPSEVERMNVGCTSGLKSHNRQKLT